MKILLFGATGMVGQGVLRECLLAEDVTEIVSFVRAPSGESSPKLRELVPPDLHDLSAFRAELKGVAGCFFCLGASSAGMQEDDYRRVTYDLTMSVAKLLAELSPNAAFIYVSGQGTDSTEQGRMMWARVKGKTENELLALFPRGCMFRPGFIRPMHGERPKAKSTRIALAIGKPLFPILHALMPRQVCTTEEIGRAMLEVARRDPPKRVLERGDIIDLGRAA